MIALSLLLALAAPDVGLAEQIVRCGIARDQVQFRYKPEAQAEIATITTPSVELSIDHLACLVGLSLNGRLLAFADPAADARFNSQALTAADKAIRDKSRQWLAERGLLDRLPVFDPARGTLAEYAVAVETLCGIAPGALLKAVDEHSLTMPPRSHANVDSTHYQCVIIANPGSRAFVLREDTGEDARLAEMAPPRL